MNPNKIYGCTCGKWVTKCTGSIRTYHCDNCSILWDLNYTDPITGNFVLVQMGGEVKDEIDS